MELMKTGFNPDELALEETLFHVANGYLGVRGSLEEGCPEGVQTIRGCYVNGFYDTVDLHYPERLYGFPEKAQRLINLPDVQTMRLFVDGEEFNMQNSEILEHTRELDSRSGTAKRKIKWRTSKGIDVSIYIIRIASFARPELFYTEYLAFNDDFNAPIMEFELVSEINCNVFNFSDDNDPRVASEKIQHIFLDNAEIVDDVGMVQCSTGASDLKLALCQYLHVHQDDDKYKRVNKVTANGVETRITIKTKGDRGLLVERLVTISDSRRQEDPRTHAWQVMEDSIDMLDNKAVESQLQEEHSDLLWDFWVGAEIQIDGDRDLQKSLTFNMFQLLQSAGRDGITSVASKGLSGEGYEGHYFWDTEIYVFPFFLYTQPETAKSLLQFRYNTLDGARQHAVIMGHKSGALYPWRTISGSECSSFFPAGSAQYHLTGDVAHAFMQYYYATDDVTYMSESGLEVLLETARLWIEAGNYGSDGKFHIHSVTGPDEYTCCVSDNYYTNRTAQHNLLGAVEVYSRLKEAALHTTTVAKINFNEAELEAFTQAAEAMYLPYCEELGIHAQDSTFLDKPIWDLATTPKEKFPLLLHYHPLYLYRYQVCKQADTVLAHFLFEDGVPEDVMRRTYMYYDKITTHDSSLSGCIFGIMASRLGLTQKAYEYFTESVRCDLDNTHGNTKDGLHVANLGGSWMAVVCGFAGLRLSKKGLSFRFSLPEKWRGYSFRLQYRGSLLQVNINKQGGDIKLMKGNPVTVFVDGVELRVGE